MIKREFDLTIRVPQQDYIDTGIKLVQNDQDVYILNLRITDGITDIDYNQVDHATITFALANGAVIQSDPERLTVSATGIIYQMGTSEIACPGKVLASIQLFGEDGERLTTARFRFEVVADLITPGAVQSESRFPLLQQLVADVEQLKQDIVDLQIPDNSVMDVKLSDVAGQIKQRFASHMADNAAHNGFVGRYQGLPNFTDFNELTTPGLYHGVISGEKLNEAVTTTTIRRLTLQVIVNTTPTTNVYQELYYQDGASTIMHRRFYRQRKNPTDWLPWFEIKTSRDIVRGRGSPEGVISATVGTLYQRTDGGAGTTLYVKESGTGNTGWIAK